MNAIMVKVENVKFSLFLINKGLYHES
jgi:hypothetical protein